jgi:hypothetical protein
MAPRPSGYPHDLELDQARSVAIHLGLSASHSQLLGQHYNNEPARSAY